MDKKNNDINSFYSTENGDFNYLYSDHIDFSQILFETLEPLFKEYKVKTVIDCCCGVGNDLKDLFQKGYDVYGSDLSLNMVNTAIKNLKKENVPTKIIQSDVLYINKNIKETFDLVVFRGNALGHLSSDEQKKAIDNLFGITKNNGLIFIDFRNGEKYHHKNKRFELRGHGIDKHNSEIYFSYYILKHPKNNFEQYKIKSRTLIFDYKKIKIRLVCSKIEANYVIPDTIIDRIKCNNGKILFEKSVENGLQHLQSLIILKI
ncbi:MAG: Glycine/sarcosine N-methyltransferase [Candidatus Ordinivivax streblomastigis]|uniref:Glycine/sarcosine N-methyltransferase n=1 Tax=Candidatus Ordinivivax streblomastigis TaxID=2540710 RepID=A0A5M8NZ57_9BACT|nr:MAG: Glycine/sarcosine N-methyltransferase [Candidatus Ordinivivax streblomastigis]